MISIKRLYCISFLVAGLGLIFHTWVLLALATILNALIGIYTNV